MNRIPLYQQVYDYIVQRIKAGEWEEGSKLPSIRMLASQLDVHRLTVLKAFQVLKENQYVYAKDKAGYYVQKTDVIKRNSKVH